MIPGLRFVIPSFQSNTVYFEVSTQLGMTILTMYVCMYTKLTRLQFLSDIVQYGSYLQQIVSPYETLES
jgi:hypothetical protein